MNKIENACWSAAEDWSEIYIENGETITFDKFVRQCEETCELLEVAYTRDEVVAAIISNGHYSSEFGII